MGLRRPRLPRRAGRRTNAALLALLTAVFATGLLAYGIGVPGPARWVAVAHGAAGLALLLLVPWKRVVVRGARARGAGSLGSAGAVLAALLVVTLVAGFAQAFVGFRAVLGVVPLQVHVGAALLAVPFLVTHVRDHPQRPRATDLSRRVALRGALLGGGALAAYAAVEGALTLLRLPGRARRATGSSEVGSGAPRLMPVTQWFTDTVPADDAAGGELLVRLGDEEHRIPYAQLPADTEVRAVLDCTGGWYAEQVWRGARLDLLLAALSPGGELRGQSVEVVSVTGYRRRLPLRDTPHLLLATAVGGAPLSAGHGAPVRLVAPGRRGFWWVKWVTRVEVLDEPWWVQPPVPLQ
ncbi:MAG: molybdopterin-dependent oxidoreductase [Actinomycetota bacterium]|nr:molybdopterin-dependent oxidoreductase [Actinomycetota bacterium]